MTAVTRLRWTPLGRCNYGEALSVQEQLRDELVEARNSQPTVFSVEHPPTITIGRNGTFTHIIGERADLEEIGMEIYEVDRGGDVTYHGPGQLVLYPVLNLAPWANDVGKYVRMLEETVIRALADVGINGERSEGFPGVWVNDAKICAIGARVRRDAGGNFITSHGLALNVCTDLSHFQTIIPCGISDRGVTSVAQLSGEEENLDVWETRLKDAFATVFSCEWLEQDSVRSHRVG